MAGHDKWLSYYQRGFTPWDSHAPCSQLLAGLAFDRSTLQAASVAVRRDGGPAAPVARGSDTERSTNGAHEADLGDPSDDTAPYPSAAGDGPSIEKMLAHMDEEIAKFESQQDETSSSKIEKLEGKIQHACRAMVGAVYENFCAVRKPDLVQAEQLAMEMCDKEARAFDDFIADVHESIRNMYSVQVRERLETTKQGLATVLALRQTEIFERHRHCRCPFICNGPMTIISFLVSDQGCHFSAAECTTCARGSQMMRGSNADTHCTLAAKGWRHGNVKNATALVTT